MLGETIIIKVSALFLLRKITILVTLSIKIDGAKNGRGDYHYCTLNYSAVVWNKAENRFRRKKWQQTNHCMRNQTKIFWTFSAISTITKMHICISVFAILACSIIEQIFFYLNISVLCHPSKACYFLSFHFYENLLNA